jgi:class 3 adenylate cyclase/TolB-like protein
MIQSPGPPITGVNAPDHGSSRRLAAIVVLDVVGYSRLMEADEGGTHDRWRALCQDTILPSLAASRGQVVKSTGDGFLIEFRSAVDAVRWALGLQERNTGPDPSVAIQLRIAVHIGDIIPEENDIFGSDVNIASRLQEFAEPGRIIVSAAVHDRVHSAVDYAVEELGEIPLKNIKRPVQAFSISAPGTAPARAASPRPERAVPDLHPAEAREASVAVLPLRILGGALIDPYFAEGLVHDIVESLAGVRELFVIASNSTVAIADAGADRAAIGRRFGARYLVSGIIGRAGERLRLFVELSDVESQSVLWKEHHDIQMSELFETQEAISTRIARSLVPHIRMSELQRALRKRPENMGAYDLVLQAMYKLNRFSGHDFQAARELLERAIARDPTYSAAHAWLASWHIFSHGQGVSRDAGEPSLDAQRCALAALEHNPADPLALAVYGHVQAFLFADYESATEAFDRAIAYAPSSAVAWGLSSPTYCYLGEYDAAMKRAHLALSLSPLDPFGFFFQTSLTMAHYLNGDDEEAVRWGKKTLAGNPRYSANMRPLIASLMRLGRDEEARKVAQALLAVEPRFRVTAFVGRYPITDPAVRAAYGDLLLAAGLPP